MFFPPPLNRSVVKVKSIATRWLVFPGAQSRFQSPLSGSDLLLWMFSIIIMTFRYDLLFLQDSICSCELVSRSHSVAGQTGCYV